MPHTAARPVTAVAPASYQAPLDALPSSATVAQLGKCLVSLIDEAQVPAQEAGVLHDVKVREGDEVKAGDELAQIDDTKTKMEVRVANAKLEAAKAKADDPIGEIYATATYKVARQELAVSEDANRRVRGVVPEVEMQKLGLKVEESRLSIEKAKLDRRVATQDANVALAEVDAAKENINRRKIRSPLDGVVVERNRHKGEWVQPGDTVFHVVRMDRLWVEGYASAKDFNAGQIAGQPVKVSITLARGQEVSLDGKVVFVKPIVLAGGGFLVRAEVENRKDAGGFWLLSPGLSAKMAIELK
jgi:multidrug resistance efflux pump